MVTGAGLHWKSGVLLPSGMFGTYCVMVTPGVFDRLRMEASQKHQTKGVEIPFSASRCQTCHMWLCNKSDTLQSKTFHTALQLPSDSLWQLHRYVTFYYWVEAVQRGGSHNCRWKTILIRGFIIIMTRTTASFLWCNNRLQRHTTEVTRTHLKISVLLCNVESV